MVALRALPSSYWFRIEQQSLAGTPDCLGTIRGMFFAIEFKSSIKAKVSKLQEYHLSRVMDCQGVSFIIHPSNWDQVYQVLENYATTGTFDETYVPRQFQ